MQNLQPNTILQNGKYKIIDMLGQGGFGITYLAMQSGLERKVAIKEFFMKEVCERDPETSHVTLGTEGGRETVLRYREKFMKEARNIAKLSHKNIVRIIDVFEENNTSYYVMEYVENGSLEGKVNREGYLSEPVATRYILQVADALDYIHQQNMSHLDVKPANIMLNEKDETVLIDFGLSKQYDAATGNQTSSTPVGISEGFAPMEQYKKGGVGEFSPKTDIYSLGATFFCLLTGVRPPSASDVFEDGLPIEKLKARGVSQKAIDIICKAMEGRKKDRLDDVNAFVNGLKQETNNKVSGRNENKIEPKSYSYDNGDTVIKYDEKKKKQARDVRPTKKKSWIKWIVNLFNDDDYSTRKEMSIEQPLDVSLSDIMSDMVYVEGGTFTMGATPKLQGSYDNDRPSHRVTLSNFYIGKYEVTQALWKAVMGSNPSYFKGDNLPVETVSWYDCHIFLSKLNAMTGKKFRLPTEAEWEYAARGGIHHCNFKYSGSDVLDEVAWFEDSFHNNTHDVGTKLPNQLGIYDMSGNVYEWCQDRYGGYNNNVQMNPKGQNSGHFRINRGGSWNSFPKHCRVTYRHYGTPDFGHNYIGLRLALSE